MPRASFKFSRIEEVLEAPRGGGPVRVGLCKVGLYKLKHAFLLVPISD